MPSMSHLNARKPLPAFARALTIFFTAVLVGCEGTATLDMGTTAAADPAIAQVLVDLEGIELQGGGGETFRFDEPVPINLAEFVDGNVFRLFTDEELSDGSYTGVRLLFSSDENDRNEDVVTLSDGREFPLTVAEGAVASVGFTVDRDESSRENVVLTLDLRQSLSFNDDSDEYSLTPFVRGVRTEDAGQIVGNVSANCPSGSSLQQGGAVYLFESEGVTPDDHDGVDPEPYLTTRIDVATTGVPTYTLAFIPEGNYTIAMTCDGDEDDAATGDDLRFQNITNVRVRAEETLTQDL